MVVMAVTAVTAAINKEALERRERLMAAKADCVAQLSEAGRRAFERRATMPFDLRDNRSPTAPGGISQISEVGDGKLLPQEIRSFIAEAHRLRGIAERKKDIKTAIKGLDTALRALVLYGRTTGAINDRRAANVTVNVVATREEGIQTAAELLLELASPAELVLLISQLQQRLAELEPLRDGASITFSSAAESSQPHLLEAPASTSTEQEKESNG